MPSDWKDAVGEDGKFKKNVIEYIKSGDGINSLDEVIGTKEVNRKLVHATIEFTNNSDKTIEDVYYFIRLKSIIEEDNGYELKCQVFYVGIRTLLLTEPPHAST